MVGWHHRLNGHEFEQTPGDGEGQGSLECCSLWGPMQRVGNDLVTEQQYGYHTFFIHSSVVDIQMANKHMKRCSTSPIIRGTEIKTTCFLNIATQMLQNVQHETLIVHFPPMVPPYAQPFP